jgi:hypothetical protein
VRGGWYDRTGKRGWTKTRSKRRVSLCVVDRVGHGCTTNHLPFAQLRTGLRRGLTETKTVRLVGDCLVLFLFFFLFSFASVGPGYFEVAVTGPFGFLLLLPFPLPPSTYITLEFGRRYVMLTMPMQEPGDISADAWACRSSQGFFLRSALSFELPRPRPSYP